MLNKALAVLGSSDQTLGKNRHSNIIINVGQSHNALWTPQITYSKSNILQRSHSLRHRAHGYVLSCSYIVKPFKISSWAPLQALLKSGGRCFIADNSISPSSQKKKKTTTTTTRTATHSLTWYSLQKKKKIHKVKIVVLFIK